MLCKTMIVLATAIALTAGLTADAFARGGVADMVAASAGDMLAGLAEALISAAGLVGLA